MCGIFGFKSPLPRQEQILTLAKMGNSIHHRGPDDDGFYHNKDLAFGMKRLSIIDLNTGKQPIISNNGKNIIVYNGELYNYIELRRRLQEKGYIFKTKSDTEVIVNLYQEMGVGCLNEFNGMFAFAIYNIETEKLFIARDRFGIKPLYYSFNKKALVFASELKAILEYPGIDLGLSHISLDLFLTFEHVPAPYTIYKNINKLENGHFLILENGNLTISKWYQLTYQPKFKLNNVDDYVEEIDTLLERAVQLRTIADVPLGAFLSGGIDSSLIVYYLSMGSKKIPHTFSIGFDEPSFDESPYARQMAQFLGTEHHEHIFSSDDLSEIFPSIINCMDEPFADPSFLPTYLLSKLTKKTVSVALSGDGGDEVFAGYPTYYARKLCKNIPIRSYQILKYLANMLPVSDSNISFDYKVKKLTDGLGYPEDIRHQIWLGSFNDKQKSQLFNKQTLINLGGENNVNSIIDDHMKFCDTDKNWERSLWCDMRFYLQDNMLVKVDRASMLHSLEVRIPFLDHNVVDYIARVPSSLKYKGNISKYILKKVAAKHLPNKIINRKKKGFGIPVAKWIKKDMRNMFEETFYGYDNNSEFFNKKYLRTLLKDHLDNKKDNRKLLWTLFIYIKWSEKNL